MKWYEIKYVPVPDGKQLVLQDGAELPLTHAVPGYAEDKHIL
jgi:hypothetical protein